MATNITMVSPTAAGRTNSPTIIAIPPKHSVKAARTVNEAGTPSACLKLADDPPKAGPAKPAERFLSAMGEEDEAESNAHDQERLRGKGPEEHVHMRTPLGGSSNVSLFESGGTLVANVTGVWRESRCPRAPCQRRGIAYAVDKRSPRIK